MKRRELKFEAMKRDKQAIAHGSKSKLRKAWDELNSQLEEGERIVATWRSSQFSMVRSIIVEGADDLNLLAQGVVIYGAHGLTFAAEPDSARRPLHLPKDVEALFL